MKYNSGGIAEAYSRMATVWKELSNCLGVLSLTDRNVQTTKSTRRALDPPPLDRLHPSSYCSKLHELHYTLLFVRLMS